MSISAWGRGVGKAFTLVILGCLWRGRCLRLYFPGMSPCAHIDTNAFLRGLGLRRDMRRSQRIVSQQLPRVRNLIYTMSNPNCSSVTHIVSFQFCRWGDWSSEQVSNVPVAIKLLRVQPGFKLWSPGMTIDTLPSTTSTEPLPLKKASGRFTGVYFMVCVFCFPCSHVSFLRTVSCLTSATVPPEVSSFCWLDPH